MLKLLNSVLAKGCHEHGFKRKVLSRIKAMIQDRGHYLDKARPGRPTKHPARVMETAQQLLVEHQGSYLTTPQLMKVLEERGALHAGADAATVRTHLKRFVRKGGHKLDFSSINTTFAMLQEDKAARVKYAKRMLAWLAVHPLEIVVFVDETQLAATPHPKGNAGALPAWVIWARCRPHSPQYLPTSR